MTKAGARGYTPRKLVPLDQPDVALLLRHLKRLRQLVDELDSLEHARGDFSHRQNVRDRLRREIDVAQAVVMDFGPRDPGRVEPRHD